MASPLPTEFDYNGEEDESSSLPQRLTKNALPILIGSLDASDVLEAYAVSRMAPLHWSNDTILVQKSAIAIRYPPPSGSNKPPLEVTLEYGPQRMGASLQKESMPMLHNDGPYISWENEGSVYYTDVFDTHDWTKANYMASMTGAVFELLLENAVEFAIHHPRYQPIRVLNADKLLLKSAASHDFVYSVWEGLAKAGVELQPILEPPAHVLQLHSTSIEKVSGVHHGRNVAEEAYQFYNSLEKCAKAIQTGNYQSWEPTASPTLTQTSTEAPTLASSTMMPTEEQTAGGTESPTETGGTGAPTDALDEQGLATAAPGEDEGTNAPSPSPTKWKKRKKNHKDEDDNAYSDGGNNKNRNANYLDDNSRWLEAGYGYEEGDDNTDIVDTNETAYEDDSVSNSTILNSTTTPPAPPEKGNEADIAKEAAQHAQEAAHEAKEAAQSPQDSKAANAAEKAANAAQAAADATYSAAHKAAMDGFMSGDGDVVTAVLRTCFDDERYGIKKHDANGTTVYGYIYMDGSNYYRVNMTHPYLDVGRVERPLPQSVANGSTSSSVDMIDWLLAFFVVVMVCLTICALFQQVGYKIAFAPWQKWFFSPRHWEEEVEKEANKPVGQGFSHSFPEDVIPLSMGGRKKVVLAGAGRDAELGDLELPTLGVSSLGGSGKSPPRRSGSIGSDIMMSTRQLDQEVTSPIPQRLSRDPDLVDLPDLRSSSKVAVPVTGYGSTGSISSHESSGSSSPPNGVA